jgi:hypothetical protein
MAVGWYVDTSGVQDALVEQWNGSSWAVQQAPNPNGEQFSFLFGVTCMSSTACEAVGQTDQGSLAASWDGANWSIQSSSTGLSPGAALFSVSCTSLDACTAVGGNNGGLLAEQWDGTTWTVEPTPTPAGSQFAFLNSVACSSASACTAVGSSSDGNTWTTVAESWDGTQWSLQSTLNEPGWSQLFGVACPQASACVAVGYGVKASGAFATLGEGWDGTQWSVQSTADPLGTHGANLNGVSCKSPSACMAVGALNEFSSNGNARGTLAEWFDGTTWRIVPTPNPDGEPDGSLNGVSCTSPSVCVAVGAVVDSSGNSVGTLTERWDGTSWTIQPTPTSASLGAFLNGISCTSPNACTAVGNNSDGQVLAERWDGTSWSIQPMPAPAGAQISSLNGVSCTSAKACTAVGGVADSSFNPLGTVAEQWNGTTWTLQPVPGSQSPGSFMEGVSCTSASACTAVGQTDSGLLAERWDGTDWTVQVAVTPPGTEGTGDLFSGVSCSSRSACTAVGLLSGGPTSITERWDGTQWSIQPTPGIPAVYDMAGPAVSCPVRSTCMAVSGYRNNGPSVTLAEQWNRQTGSTALTTSFLKGDDRAASQTSCPRPVAFEFSPTLSPSERFRPAIQPARATSRALRALQRGCRT